jgi:hypothetical protein
MYGKMTAKIINVLCFFLGFVESFFQNKAHNMVVLMLDPCFKGMDCIMDYIGRDQATTLMQQYDDLIVMPMLKAIIDFLNPNQTTSLDPPPPKQPSTSCGLFGVVTSIQEATKGLLKAKLFLFHIFHMENVDSLDPLMWWTTNESRFPNVGFLARQILGIMGSHIETMRIFSVASVLTSL